MKKNTISIFGVLQCPRPRGWRSHHAVALLVALFVAFGSLAGNGNGNNGNGNNGNGNNGNATAPGQLKKQKTDAELLDILREKYDRDTANKNGRKNWHGKCEKQIVDEENLIQIEVYADGTVFTNAWEVVTPKSAADAQARKLSSLTNNVPARLAAARLAREAQKAQGVQEVVIEKEVGQ